MEPLDVYELARTGRSIEGTRALANMPRLASSLMRTSGELRFRARGGTDALGRAALNLHLQAELVLACDRCGGPVAFVLDVERPFYFVDSEEVLAAVQIDESPEEALLGSTRFDLAGLIEDEAILQLPLSPRHDDCHAAVTAGDAGGQAQAQPEHPFAGLQDLRDRLRAQTPPPAGDSDEKGAKGGKLRH